MGGECFSVPALVPVGDDLDERAVIAITVVVAPGGNRLLLWPGQPYNRPGPGWLLEGKRTNERLIECLLNYFNCESKFRLEWVSTMGPLEMSMTCQKSLEFTVCKIEFSFPGICQSYNWVQVLPRRATKWAPVVDNERAEKGTICIPAAVVVARTDKINGIHTSTISIVILNLNKNKAVKSISKNYKNLIDSNSLSDGSHYFKFQFEYYNFIK